MPCKLPSKLIRPPARYLRDIAIGETVHVVFTSMKPDAEGYCYLDPNADICEPRNINSIQVTCAKDGWHVVIVHPGLDWELGRSSIRGWFPVESITGNNI